MSVRTEKVEVTIHTCDRCKRDWHPANYGWPGSQMVLTKIGDSTSPTGKSEQSFDLCRHCVEWLEVFLDSVEVPGKTACRTCRGQGKVGGFGCGFDECPDCDGKRVDMKKCPTCKRDIAANEVYCGRQCVDCYLKNESVPQDERTAVAQIIQEHGRFGVTITAEEQLRARDAEAQAQGFVSDLHRRMHGAFVSP